MSYRDEPAERVLAILTQHPRGLSTAVICEHTGLRRLECAMALRELVRDGQVTQPGRGFYRACPSDASPSPRVG